MVLFVWHSLLAGGLTAFLLLPTLMALINSKVAYMKADLNWTLDYSIPKLISKFMIGAFNFDQMPSGYPNVFIGSLALLSFFLFFFNHSFPKKERLSAFIITSFFVLSMNIKALNKIWHAMQFPNWYPYRFSFVVCFFLIVLGFRNFKRFKGLTPLRTFFAIILWAAAGLYTYQQKFDFIEPFQIILTLLFVMIIILLLILKNNQYAWLPLAFFLVTAAEMSTNAALSLSRLSYVDQNSFSIYQLSMQDIRDQIRTTDEQFYRIEKTFLRSKNDSLQADFQSITHFSSTFESSIPELFGKLGFPQGSGFLTYSNGTLITDAFFGVKYYLSEQSNTYELPTETLSDYVLNQSIPLDKEVFTSSILNRSQVLHHLSEPDNEKENFSLTLLQTKPDLRKYQKLSATPKVILYQNPFALPIAFGSSDDILTVDEESNPIRMQEAILNGLLGKTDEEDYFSRLPFDNVFYVNTSTIEDAAFQQVERDDTSDEASITFQFTPQTDDAYYMTMGSSVKDKDISLFLNNKPFTQYDNYNDTLILNLANQNKYETIAFKMKLEDEPVSLEDIQLYQLNQSSFEQSVKDLKAGGMIVDEYSNTSLKGTVTILPEQSFLMTTIPYSEGWSVNVDGVPVTPVKALDSLLAVPVKEGKHTVVFSYRNLYLNQGILLSFISLAFLFLPAYLK
ncbi:MAG: YfhO family protein, partial [Pisciglobus halotolerans]|nr:YfhO family protein [Pisciglobus halotolerans]